MADAPHAGCMTCKALRPYTVELVMYKGVWNGNTVWRCQECRTVIRLIPGPYLPRQEHGPAEGEKA